MTVFSEKFSSSVATGTQNVTLSLTKGTKRRIIEVSPYIPGAGDSAFIEVHRTAGTPASSSKKGETYYNANPIIILDEQPDHTSTTLKLRMNTGNAGTVTCYFTVRYDYI